MAYISIYIRLKKIIVPLDYKIGKSVKEKYCTHEIMSYITVIALPLNISKISV